MHSQYNIDLGLQSCKKQHHLDRKGGVVGLGDLGRKGAIQHANVAGHGASLIPRGADGSEKSRDFCASLIQSPYVITDVLDKKFLFGS